MESELTTQHGMIQTDISDAQTAIQSDIAAVKALVEALEVGAAGPLCGAETEGQRFVVSQDDTEVCDNTTGLSWVKTPGLTRGNHAAAITHCAGLDLGNGQAYRLPEVKELISLVDYSQASPALPPGHPFVNIQLDGYWSATTFALIPSLARDVDFRFGDVSALNKTLNVFVWCARSGS